MKFFRLLPILRLSSGFLWHSSLMMQHSGRSRSQQLAATTSLHHTTEITCNISTNNNHIHKDSTHTNTQQQQQQRQQQKTTVNGTVTVLERGSHYIVVSKPPAVVCHHSDYTASRSMKNKKEPEIPMLQRVRQAIGQRVNLIHRLDRGCSGCLLFSLQSPKEEEGKELESMVETSDNDHGQNKTKNTDDTATATVQATSALIDAMAEATRTYVAIVRGEGIVHGRDFKKEGWFEVNRPIKDEKGNLNDATTLFRFVAGQANVDDPHRPRASLVLARPKTGRWHQIRRHLNGLSHPILGDSSHGNSKVNREWRDTRGLPYERTCLHLCRLELPPIPQIGCPDGITVQSPLPPDMVTMLKDHLPDVWKEAKSILEKEEKESFLLLEEDPVDHRNSTAKTILPYEVTVTMTTNPKTNNKTQKQTIKHKNL